MTVKFVVHNKQPLATKFTAMGYLFNYNLITKPSDEWYQVVFFEAYNSVANPKHFAKLYNQRFSVPKFFIIQHSFFIKSLFQSSDINE